MLEEIGNTIREIEAIDEEDEGSNLLVEEITNSALHLLNRPHVSALPENSATSCSQPPPKKPREPYRFRNRRIIPAVAELNTREFK